MSGGERNPSSAVDQNQPHSVPVHRTQQELEAVRLHSDQPDAGQEVQPERRAEETVPSEAAIAPCESVRDLSPEEEEMALPLSAESPTASTEQLYGAPCVRVDAPAGAPSNHDILESLGQIADQQQKLSEMFDEKFRYDAARDDIIDKLHKELQEHRNDMLAKVILPVLRDMIPLSDEVVKFVEARRKYPEERRSWDNLLDNVASFSEDIIEILERYGMVAFREEGIMDPENWTTE